MKKRYKIVVLLAVFSLLVSNSFADSSKLIRLKMYSRTAFVNENPIQMDVPPVEIQGRTMVPLRFISEQMGIKDIQYNPSNQEVQLRVPNTEAIGQENNLLRATNHLLVQQNRSFMDTIWGLKYERSSLTTISEMESKWTDFYKNGSYEIDNIDFKTGAGSLKIKAYPESVPCGLKSDLPITDLSRKGLRLYLKTPKWDDLLNFSIAFGASNGWSDYFVLDLKTYLRNPPDNEWIELILSRSSFKAFGSPSWEYITGMIIRISAKTALPATAWIDGFSVFNTKGFGAVSFAFDRGYKSVITNALPLLKPYKYTGNLFVSTDTIGTNGYLKQEDIDYLSFLGWNIGGQSKSDLSVYSDLELKNQVGKISTFLQEKGYKGSRNFALPYGRYNKRIQDVIRNYFSTIRGNDSLNQPKEFLLSERINSQFINAGTTFDEIQQWINTAYTNGDWLILVFYGVEPLPLVDTDCRLEVFTRTLDYIQRFKIPVKTFDEQIYN